MEAQFRLLRPLGRLCVLSTMLVAVACGSSVNARQGADIEVGEVLFDARDLNFVNSVEWVDANTIMFAITKYHDGRAEDDVVEFDLTNGELVETTLPPTSPTCDFIQVYQPQRMLDGRMAIIRTCTDSEPDNDPRGSLAGISDAVVAWDFHTGQTQTLVHAEDFVPFLDPEYHLEGFSPDITAFSLSRSEDRMLVGLNGGSALARSFIVDLQTGSIDPLLADKWAQSQAFEPGDTKALVLVRQDSSPDSKSPKLIFDTVEIDLEKGQRRLYFERNFSAGGFSFSADGSYLAFNGEIEGDKGLWLYDIGADSFQKIWDREVVCAWHPTKNEMVIVDEDLADILIPHEAPVPLILSIQN